MKGNGKEKKAIDLTKVCWSCLKMTMQPVPGKGYYQCRDESCKATYVDIPKPARTGEMEVWTDPDTGTRHFHPTGVHD